MKKALCILAVMTMATMAMAQQKVAILETVDKAQNVSYGVKLLLRSSLTSAISNTPGYEGYDRVDMASIAGEQEFQRTGNVSDNQIKQIGRAAGASYVLVAEAARYDATSIIITAKLLDVETFGVKSSAVLVSGVSADEMQESCSSLAAKLLNTQPQSRVATPSVTKDAPSNTTNLASNETTAAVNASPVNTTVGRKNPWVTGICSFLIPGLGQVINGEYLKAGLFFGGYVASYGLILAGADGSEELATVGGLLLAGIYIWNIVDAVTSSNRINAQNGYTINLGERTNLGIMPTVDYLNLPVANASGFSTGVKVSLTF